MATRKIETELQLSGEKEFNDAMKGVNSNLKNIKADMERVTTEFAENADSMEALTAKEKVLKESIEQHRAKVEALEKMYKKQVKANGENSAAADNYRLQLTKATTAMLKEENALKKTQTALAEKKAAEEAAADASDDLAKSEKKVAAAAEDAAKSHDKYADKAERAEKRTEALKNGMEKLGGAAKAAAAATAALAAAGGVALAGMVNRAKEAAEAAKAAQEAGEELTAAQQQWLAFSGQLDTLSATAPDAKSALASILLPTLSQLSSEGTAFLGDFVASMSAAAGDTQKQTEILGQYIGKGAKLILEKLPEYIKSGRELLKSVGKGLSENKDELLDLGQELLEDLLRSVIDNAPKLAEGGLEMVLQMIEGIDGEDMAATASQLVTRLVNGLSEAAPKLIPAAVKLVSELVVGLAKNAPELLGSGVDLLMNVIDGILSAVGEIPKMWRQVFDVLISAMRSSDSEIMQFGANVVEKIADGILGAWDWLIDWFNGLWDNLFPGENVDVSVNAEASGAAVDGSHAAGLRYVPFDGYLAELHRGEAILPAAEAEAYRSGKTAGAKVVNLTINTKSLSQAEADALIEYMNRKLGDDL
jgi:hypothetical protein